MAILVIENNIPHTVETTYEELQHALQFYAKERERWRLKNKERNRNRSTGRPVGRPKKNSDTPVAISVI